MTVEPFLRQTLADADDATATLSRLGLERAAADDDRTRAAIESRMGEYLSLAPDTRERAIRLLEHVAERAAAGSWTEVTAPNDVRLATALQYADRHEEAVALFEASLERLDAGTELHHVALQHYGKCLAELERCDEARQALEAALAARQATNATGMAESTQAALTELERRAR